MNDLTKSTMLMLRSDCLDNASSIAASVIEEELFDLIHDYVDFVEDGLNPHVVHDHYWAQVAGRLYDHNGNLRTTGNEHDYWNVVNNPAKAIKGYVEEIDNQINTLMDNNHDALLEVCNTMIVHDVRVARRLPGVWVVEVIGAMV